MEVHVNVENFGPIEKAEIDLRPLTVFVGESNTGKTYLAALIYALHQHFRGISQFPLLSPISSLFRYAYRYPQSQLEEIEKEMSEILEKLNTPKRPFKFSDLPQLISAGSESLLTDQTDFTNELERCFDLESVSKLIRFTEDYNNEMHVLLSVSKNDQKYWDFEMRATGTSDPTITGYINPDIVFLDSNAPIRKTKFHEISDIERLFRSLDTRRRRARKSYYLPAARSGIMQSRDVLATALIKRATRIGLDRLEVSTFSGMIGDFLEQIFQYERRNRSSSKIGRVAEQLETDLLGGKIEVKRLTSEAYPEILYHPKQSKAGLRMSHSSAMVSELTPLVLFLRGVVGPDDLLIIEEPESHLHPAAQTKVAVTLARLIRAGVRVLITTHSEWMLEQIGNLVLEGEVMKLGKNKRKPSTWLMEEDVGAWWFRPDKPVEEIKFEHIGGIEPMEYGAVAQELYNDSVNLRAQLEDETGGTEVE